MTAKRKPKAVEATIPGAKPLLPFYRPKRFDLKEIGFTLKASDQCLRDLEEIERNQRLAVWRCRDLIFD